MAITDHAGTTAHRRWPLRRCATPAIAAMAIEQPDHDAIKQRARQQRVHNTGFKASESREAEGTTRARYAAEQRRAAGRNKYGHLAARRLTAVAVPRIGVAAADGGAVGQTRGVAN